MKLYALKVEVKQGEKAKKHLLSNGLLNKGYRVFRRGNFIYFPLLGRGEKRIGIGKTLRADFKKIRGAEKGFGRRGAVKSYDLLGNIAVVEDVSYAGELARHIMRVNKNVKTVVKKAGAVHGIYRTRGYGLVAGERRYIANYKENNCTFTFDIRKVFFSPRLAFERKRVSGLVGNGENVLVMFAGVGPFAIEIAKEHMDAKVVAIELNRDAYRYMLENIKRNKVSNVVPVMGDVRRVARHYAGFADRIVMPLPKDSYDFLGSALLAAKKECHLHYYAFGSFEDAFSEQEERIRKFFRGKAEVDVTGSRVVRPYSAKEIEIVIDFLIRRIE